MERLRNETDCLQYIRDKTNIPVPSVEYTYESEGVFYLVMGYVKGELLSDLLEEQKAPYLQELKGYMDVLHSLRSKTLGGPRGLIVPPIRVLERTQQRSWCRSQVLESADYVFCHNDLAEHNIIVDTGTGHIKAIIDWEYGGFWPKFFEAPVYTRKGPRKQTSNDSLANVKRMEDFLRLNTTLRPV